MVIGGTGMLSACASTLVDDGWHVILPSRRHAPIPTAAGNGGTGRALWIAADWSDPAAFAERARRVLRGPVELLVAWVHREHRADVLRAVSPLLEPGAPVVEVHGSAAADAKGGYPDPILADHTTQQVVLGYLPVGRTSRRLTHEEISDGVLVAVRRALAGGPPAVQQVGRPRRWSLRN